MEMSESILEYLERTDIQVIDIPNKHILSQLDIEDLQDELTKKIELAKKAGFERLVEIYEKHQN